MSNSQSSSGCESGWTSYFDEPTLSLSRLETPYAFPEQNYRGNAAIVEKEEEEGDQSMLSDASSGLRYYYTDDREPCTLMERISKNETSQGVGRQSYLDDTATSSTVSSINQRNPPPAMTKAADKSLMDFLNGFQSSHFGGKPAFYDTFGFMQSSLNLSEKKVHQKKQVTSREDNGKEKCWQLQGFAVL